MNDDNVFAPGGDHRPTGDGTYSTTPLELEALFRRAWELLSENIMTFLPIVGALFALSLVSGGVGFATGIWGAMNDGENQLVAQLVGNLVTFVVMFAQLFLNLGLIRMALALDRGQEASTEMLFEQGANYPRALLVGFLLAVIVVIGLLLLVVPGIYASIALSFVMILVVDTDTSAVDIMGDGFELTKGWVGFLFIQGIVLGLLSLVLYCLTCGLAAPFAGAYYIILQCVTYNAIRAVKGA